MDNTKLITQCSEWRALQQQRALFKSRHLKNLFSEDPRRFENYSRQACGIFLDYSHNHCEQPEIDLLMKLAQTAHLKQAIEMLFAGQVVNQSEQQPALHNALRNFSTDCLLVNGQDVLQDVRRSWQKMELFSQKIREGSYRGLSGKPIKSIVNIGIGGSDLGPKMLVYALQEYVTTNLDFYFISNLDKRHIGECLAKCDPETTLFICASKSFTTQETLVNLAYARQWMGRPVDQTQQHFVAICANPARAYAEGFIEENIFPFWSWVGGRYSLWSAVGLSLAIAIGMDQFKKLLQGAEAMDQHFAQAPFANNLPVIMALIGIWYNNFFHYPTRAIIPYHQGLLYFPEYMQQLHMESLGKNVKNNGEPVDCATGGIIWGGSGTNCQHSFYQLLLQGTHVVPTDFIFPLANDHMEMIANCLAQSEVFTDGYQSEGATCKKIGGDIPHNIIILDKLNPQCLGALLALYEHKVYAQSVIWGINAFDQWGVQRGKVLAQEKLAELANHSASSSALTRMVAEKLHA